MGELLLTNARVLDGLGGESQNATVRLDDGRVAEISPGADAVPGPGFETLDLSGKTLMPALVDAHVHLPSYEALPPLLRGEEPRADAVHNFELANFAVRVGASADLLVVDGDPLEDPSVLQDPARIHFVLQAGRPVNAA